MWKKNNMKQLNLNEIKNREFIMLCELDKFCKKNALKYYIAGGTLLGAIRHKGFIPWDDDIDVCMPRKDYEWLIRNFKSNYKEIEIKSKLSIGYDIPFAKIVDKNTIIYSKFMNHEFDKMLWIDIFPIDGLPKDLEKVKNIYKKCNFYRKILLLTEANLGEGTNIFRKYIKYILKPLARLYGKKRCVDKLEKIALSNNYDISEYVGAVTWGLYGIGERMLKIEFEKSVEVEFEGCKFPTFSCWDSYLSGLYGNYLELPPISKRSNHNFAVYLKNN